MEGRGRRQRGRKVVGLQAIVYHLFGSNWGGGTDTPDLFDIWGVGWERGGVDTSLN